MPLPLSPHLGTGQLEYATDALLADRGFEGRAFPEGRKRYVIPTDEVVANFYQSSKAGQKMTVGGAVRWVTGFVCALPVLHSSHSFARPSPTLLP